MHLYHIHIGSLIQQKVKEKKIDIRRICKFFNQEDEDIYQMYKSESLDSHIVLKWCKLLKYDFFRIYSQHLILYSPPNSPDCSKFPKSTDSDFPQFRKNIYTKEMIEFILELIAKGEKTKNEIILDYKIPKSTLYKWIQKFEI